MTAHVLLAMAVVVVLSRLLGVVFQRWLHQPPVIGEIAAGLALGPSLFGAVWPSARNALFPESVAPHLGMVANIGIVLFMFLVGLEVDLRFVRENTRKTLAISLTSIAVPFALGVGLSFFLHARYANPSVGLTAFSLFIGTAMAVTAFPVLARILLDRNLQRTPLGALALSSAAVGDVVAWTLLAVTSAVATTRVVALPLQIGGLLVYVALMLAFVRPAALWLAEREERSEADTPLSHTALAWVLVALLVSAATTEILGIHALFGAFLLGAFLPHEGRLAQQVRTRTNDLVVVLFLPVFFAFTGMRTDLGLLNGMSHALVVLAVLATATVGKTGGTYLGARVSGIPTRDAAALGVLMNTRGLVELVVLNVGLDLGVISPSLFAILVVMALVTTFATSPALDCLLPRTSFRGHGHGAGEDKPVA